MPLNTLPGEIDIFERISTITGLKVMEGEYASDSYIPKLDANKMFQPYALIKYNPAFPAYDDGIVGPDKDTLRATFSVYVVSPDDRVTREFSHNVREVLLTDFKPTDGSSLKPGGGYSFVDSDLGYNRYVQTGSFAYTTNLS